MYEYQCSRSSSSGTQCDAKSGQALLLGLQQTPAPRIRFEETLQGMQLELLALFFSESLRAGVEPRRLARFGRYLHASSTR